VDEYLAGLEIALDTRNSAEVHTPKGYIYVITTVVVDHT